MAGVGTKVEGGSRGKGGGGVVECAILWFTNIKWDIQLKESSNSGAFVKMIVFGYMMFIIPVKYQQQWIMLKIDFI